MIKMVDVDKVPDKGPKLSDVISDFIKSEKRQVMLDLTDEKRTLNQVFSGLYNASKSKWMNVDVRMIDGQIYLVRNDMPEEPEPEAEAEAE